MNLTISYMKRFILSTLCVLALSVSAIAQKSFEGHINFGITLDGGMADQMAGMMPTAYNYTIKGKNILMKMEGGMASMMGDILINGEKSESYMVNHMQKTAFRMPEAEEAQAVAKPKIEKLGDEITIAGYKCVKYKMETETPTPQGNMNMVQYMWVTDALNIERPAKAIGNTSQMFIEGVDGFPLKMEMEIPMTGGTMMVFEATEVKKEKISDDEFTFSSDYKVKDFDPSALGGMGGFGN